MVVARPPLHYLGRIPYWKGTCRSTATFYRSGLVVAGFELDCVNFQCFGWLPGDYCENASYQGSMYSNLRMTYSLEAYSSLWSQKARSGGVLNPQCVLALRLVALLKTLMLLKGQVLKI